MSWWKADFIMKNLIDNQLPFHLSDQSKRKVTKLDYVLLEVLSKTTSNDSLNPISFKQWLLKSIINAKLICHALSDKFIWQTVSLNFSEKYKLLQNWDSVSVKRFSKKINNEKKLKVGLSRLRKFLPN